jgi:hypothetical protein
VHIVMFDAADHGSPNVRSCRRPGGDWRCYQGAAGTTWDHDRWSRERASRPPPYTPAASACGSGSLEARCRDTQEARGRRPHPPPTVRRFNTGEPAEMRAQELRRERCGPLRACSGPPRSSSPGLSRDRDHRAVEPACALAGPARPMTTTGEGTANRSMRMEGPSCPGSRCHGAADHCFPFHSHVWLAGEAVPAIVARTIRSPRAGS